MHLAHRAVASGAAGLAQCYEVVTQLRCEARARQVPFPHAAVAHNIAIGQFIKEEGRGNA